MGDRPRTKAPKAEQLKGELQGDLAAYEQFGLFQRSVNRNTAYRYRGALLRYQIFLGANPPSLNATYEYLATLRKSNFDPATLRVYRAALSGYHQWRGEELKFKVKVPDTAARYVPWEVVQRMLEMASAKPHDQLILRLMTDAGLRRDEVVNLTVGNVEGSRLRFRGKGGKERSVPMTDELRQLVHRFAAGRSKPESLVELGEKGVYLMVKRYAGQAGSPDLTPHDLRRAFATRLQEVTENIRVVQEVLGHSNVNTTQIYTAVTGKSVEAAVKRLNSRPSQVPPPEPATGPSRDATGRTAGGATIDLQDLVKEHWRRLAFLADYTARGILTLGPIAGLPAFAEMAKAGTIPEGMDGAEALMFLKHNRVFKFSEQPPARTEGREANLGLYPHLTAHLKAEDPDWDLKLDQLKKLALNLHRVTYPLADKIHTEAERRTGLKYSTFVSQPGTLYYTLPQTIFRQVLAGSVPEFGFPPTVKDDGVTLWVDGVGMVAWARTADQRAFLEMVCAELIAEVRRWREFKAASGAHENVARCLAQIGKKMEQVALRATFKGTCEVCP